MKQTISEIVDRRLDQQALDDELSAIARDADARVVWRNYHLIGDVIRGEVAGGSCMLYRMDAAMEKEPTVLAPTAKPTTGKTAALGSTRTGLSSDAARSAGLFAIAASLALVAVLTLSPQSGVDPVPGAGGVNGGQIAAVEPAANTGSGSLNQDQVQDQAQLQAQAQAQAAFESEFGQMLVEHGEFTATSGLNGLIAYAKLVSNQQLGE